jgi:putative hydrolase of the HAD superfamily
MIQALVFDLDDTLYQERDFVASGYQAVARHLAGRCGCSFESAFSIMMTTLDTLGRDKVFPALLERLPDVSIPLAELVAVYRQHSPMICLFPGYLELLRDLARQYRLGVITDGLPDVQERKVRALGLESVVGKVIYTWEYGLERQKPHPFAFSLMLEALHADPESTLFVGDNPDKDCRGAHGVGMKCAEVWRFSSKANPLGLRAKDRPEFVINTLLELPQILEQMSQD